MGQLIVNLEAVKPRVSKMDHGVSILSFRRLCSEATINSDARLFPGALQHPMLLHGMDLVRRDANTSCRSMAARQT